MMKKDSDTSLAGPAVWSQLVGTARNAAGPLFEMTRDSLRSCRWILLVSAAAVLGSTRPTAVSSAEVKKDGEHWIGTWAASPQPFMPGRLQSFRNQTLRLIVHSSAGGTKVRIRVSNTFGDRPLLLGGAHIARRTTDANVDPTSDRALTFHGHSSAKVPAGSTVVSDPADLDLPPLSDLAISLFFPETTEATTLHLLALQTSYVSPEIGNSTAEVKFPVSKTIVSWPFLTGVDVAASTHGAAIVAFGSSTTDGDGSTLDANRRWPDVLAERLQEDDERGADVSVLNQGIIGNRLLNDSPQQAGSPFGAALGQSGLVRFERDVLAQAGVKYVIMCLGINDIIFPGSFTPSTEGVSADRMIAGYRQLIARAHKKGIRVIGTTIPPFENSFFTAPKVSFYTPEKEALRQAVNTWIRSSSEFDGLVDFDVVLRDPSHPTRLLSLYDSGDHLHNNDAGYIVSGNAIPLAWFESD